MLLKMGCGGVDLSSLHPAMWKVVRAVSKVWGGEEPVITSTWEGTHLAWSYHYRKGALDWRTPKVGATQAVLDLKERLGPNYDVVEEGDHIHTEYDPKGA